MQALVVEVPHPGAVRLDERPVPTPGAGMVRVRTLEVGLCGTDVDIVGGGYGEAPAGHGALVLGHENLGLVDSGGTGLEPGELVVATVRRPCPELCANCRNGAPDMCSTGHYRERGIKGLDGFASTCYLEDPAYLVPVPAALRDVAVLLEPLTVAEKGLRQAERVQNRLQWQPRRALVTGAGPVGLLAALALRLRGFETTVLDIVSADHPKAQRARELGARFVQGDAHAGLTASFCDALGPQDLVIEATGVSAISFPAVLALAPNGVLVRLGLSGAHRSASVPADAINQSMVLDNLVALGSVSANRVDYEQGVADMQESERMFPGWLARLISRRVPLQAYETALDRLPTDIKVVLTLEAAASA